MDFQWLILQLRIFFFSHTALHTTSLSCGPSWSSLLWETWILLSIPPLTMLQEAQDSKLCQDTVINTNHCLLNRKKRVEIHTEVNLHLHPLPTSGGGVHHSKN